MRASLRLICVAGISALLWTAGWAVPIASASPDSNPSNTPPAKTQKNAKAKTPPGKEMGNGGGDVAKGVGKGTGSLAKGTGKSVGNLAHGNVTGAGSSFGKGVGGLGKNVGEGTGKGIGKVGKGIGGEFKKL
jgi:hypothetical protein